MIDEALKRKLLAKYSDNLANSENKNHYLRYAQHFLNTAEGLDRASIDQYIGNLRKKNKPGTVNFAFRVIRRLFAVNKIDWVYRQGEAPLIKQRDEYRPQLSIESIGAIIIAAKNGKLFPHEQCFVALSTTYGLRRTEMANLRLDDINLKTRALFIATVKFGRERYHLIPPEIMPYIEQHDFNEHYALATLNVIFKHILLKCKIRLPNVGWHSIRRALYDSGVKNGIDALAMRAFMRWKGATGELAMPARYYGNVVVGLGTTTPVLNEAKGDEDVFEKHPFLPFWGNNA
jgi:integrase